MATVHWNTSNGNSTKKHIEGFFGETLCGVQIPQRGKEWNVFGEATCKRCLKVEAKNNAEDE